MPHRTIDCLACSGAFTVDVDQEESRCLSCGTKYRAPWDAPEVVSSPVPDVEAGQTPGESVSESEAATDGGREAVEIDAGPGQTVEIVIRIR